MKRILPIALLMILTISYCLKGNGQQARTVKLDNGRITLDIPPDAIPAGTQISLKASSASFPDTASVLKRFELLPAGTVFKKPVTLTIKYDDELLKGHSPFNVGIAFQHDADKQWYAPLNGKVDTVNKTISLKITHFSHWSIFSCFHLYFKVNGRLYRDDGVTIPMLTGQHADMLLVMDLPPLSADDYMKKLLDKIGEKLKKDPVKPKSTPDCPDCDILAPVHYHPIKFDDIQSKAIKPDEWLVNGVKNGNDKIGKITAVINKNYQYTAPVKMPQHNPMAVTAVINTKTNGQLQIIRHVNVYARDWHLEYHQTYEDKCEGEDDFGYGYQAEIKYVLDFHLKDGFAIGTLKYNPMPLEMISFGNCTVCESDVRLTVLPHTGIFLSNIKTSFLPEKNNPFPFQITINGDAKIYAAFHATWKANVCGDDPFSESKDGVLDDYEVKDFPLGWLPLSPGKTDIRLGDPDPRITATIEVIQ